MGFFDRFIKKPIEPSITKRTVPELSGGMTAHQAWAVVLPAAKALDRSARLILITSGLDMNDKGRSHTWEFLFFLSERNATVMFSLESDPQAEDIDRSPCILTQRIHPASSIDTTKPALPERFRDSPDVVAEFSANGVDFVAGPSDMKIEGRIRSSGDAVWSTYYWDRQYDAYFSKDES